MKRKTEEKKEPIPAEGVSSGPFVFIQNSAVVYTTSMLCGT